MDWTTDTGGADRSGHAREDWRRLSALFGGAAMIGYGILRQSFGGALLAAGGGGLIYLARRRARRAGPVDLVRVITVNAPRDEVYRLWLDFERLPQWIRHLDAVVLRDEDGRVVWSIRPPGLPAFSWVTEVGEVREGELLSWHTVGEGPLGHRGRVELRDAPGGRGTEVRVHLSFDARGPLSRGLLRLFDRLPTLGLLEDLRNFKSLAETGEVPTISGQPHGVRPVLGRLLGRAPQAGFTRAFRTREVEA
jgi:uncharacterized membrane protein